MEPFIYRSLLLCVVLVTANGCALVPANEPNPEIDVSDYVPFFGGNEAVIQSTSYQELQQYQLVSTSMVAAMTQIKEMNPSAVTLQVRSPASAFGNVLIRTLEEAGYGLQLVSADQGVNYVAYLRRIGESDSGPVLDFVVSVGLITMSREYYIDDNERIFPASLLTLKGTDSVPDLSDVDRIFKEQGGDDVFISGLDVEQSTAELDVSQVKVKKYDKVPLDKRTSNRDVLDRSKSRAMLNDPPPQLENYEKFRRTVLIFDNENTQFLGKSNKRAVGLLAREYAQGDKFVITACNDIDGKNPLAQMRAVRVEEELISYGLEPDSTYIAPCVRASYRHPLDSSPSPVDLTHYRRVE